MRTIVWVCALFLLVACGDDKKETDGVVETRKWSGMIWTDDAMVSFADNPHPRAGGMTYNAWVRVPGSSVEQPIPVQRGDFKTATVGLTALGTRHFQILDCDSCFVRLEAKYFEAHGRMATAP